MSASRKAPLPAMVTMAMARWKRSRTANVEARWSGADVARAVRPGSHVSGECRRRRRVGELDVDGGDGGVPQIRQVDARLEALLPEAHRIRDGLVDPGDAKPLCVGASRVAGQLHDLTDAQVLALEQLTRYQHVGGGGLRQEEHQGQRRHLLIVCWVHGRSASAAHSGG
jgi:hypothetical protein